MYKRTAINIILQKRNLQKVTPGVMGGLIFLNIIHEKGNILLK
jgi:hypothetical protein